MDVDGSRKRSSGIICSAALTCSSSSNGCPQRAQYYEDQYHQLNQFPGVVYRHIQRPSLSGKANTQMAAPPSGGLWITLTMSPILVEHVRRRKRLPQGVVSWSLSGHLRGLDRGTDDGRRFFG